jgi:hypothetical protein
MRRNQTGAGRQSLRSLRRWAAVLFLSVCLLSSAGTMASADDHDPTMTGHPLRIIAYVLHPIGVALDYLIFRPAHWLASQEPIQTLVGHED